MQSAFNDDQVQFRDVVSRFLQEKSPPSVTRTLMDTEAGFDPATWQQLCNEVGLAGTHIPETFGGFGFGPVELGIALEEMGRHIYTGPFFSSAVMASYALLYFADERVKQDLLPGLAAGTHLTTLALDTLDRPDRVGRRVSADNGRLNGNAPLVMDAHIANSIFVIAQTEGELALFQVDPAGDGLTRTPVQTLDPTRRLSDLSFKDAPAERIGQVSDEALSKLWDTLCVALAHEMIGGAQHLLDSTIEYTKMRYQFGRPIGSFQSLKHRCADLLMEVEWAKAATHHAARCLATAQGEPYLPSMVKALTSDTYMHAAREAIQMRGGIGFTWEEDTHLWYKRAKSCEVFLGTPAYHRERMMCLIENEEAAA